MAGCSEITANIGRNCTDPIQAGAEDLMVVIPRADWLNASVGVNISNPQIVESIILASGVTGYSYQGMNKSILPKYELLKTDFSVKYTHEVSFKVFNISPTIKKELESLAQGLYVVIVANKYHGTGGNASFEIYGADAGLSLTTMIREVGNAELGGAFDLVLTTSEEPNMPKTLFITNYAASKAIFDGLYV